MSVQFNSVTSFYVFLGVRRYPARCRSVLDRGAAGAICRARWSVDSVWRRQQSNHQGCTSGRLLVLSPRFFHCSHF